MINNTLEKNRYLLAIAQFQKFGPKRLNRLKNYFDSWESAFKSTYELLLKAGIEESLAQEFCLFRKNMDPQAILAFLEKNEIKITVLGEEDYPKLLSAIYDPPLLIYYKGDIRTNNNPPLAVVGSRKHTNYGREIIETLVSDLAKNKLCLVSGLALGIDSLAHEKALEQKTKTIAVLGSGIDQIYPKSNYQLAFKILSNDGCLVSEFPLGTPPLKQNFPQRNRIISGLSLGVLVVEARERSGSLITAFCALEQGREVFAVPGNIHHFSSVGPNELIKKGAILVSQAEDVLTTLKIQTITEEIKVNQSLNENEKLILACFKKGATQIEEIFYLTKLDTRIINSTLSILEIKKIIKNTGNNSYIIL